jgi:hypothetical protein
MLNFTAWFLPTEDEKKQGKIIETLVSKNKSYFLQLPPEIFIIFT